MKGDINIPKVEGVEVAAVKRDEQLWDIVIINRNDFALQNVLITSKGYGKKNGKKQETSTLRHMIEQIEPNSFAKVEPIKSNVLHLTNEYWVSYYLGTQIYDKKYIFVPDSIQEKNISSIPGYDLKGVIHK